MELPTRWHGDERLVAGSMETDGARWPESIALLSATVPISACTSDFSEGVILYQMGLVAMAGLAGVVFATYQSYRAWGGGWAVGIGTGLFLVNLVPYLGPIVVAWVAKRIYVRALDETMEDALEESATSDTSNR
jgi:hypothetical protein